MFLEKLERTPVPVAIRDHIGELHEAQRKEVGEDHPHQPAIEAPERERDEFVAPVLRPKQVAQAEDEQRHRQHAIDAHQRSVAVVGGQLRAYLVETYNGQINEEAEDTRAEKIPEPDRSKEHDRPAMREWAGAPALLMCAEVQERPSLHRQEHQGNDLRR